MQKFIINRIYLFIILFLLSIFSLNAKDKCIKIKNDEAIAKYNQAVKFLESKKNNDAYGLLVEAVKIEPQYYEAYYYLAMINYQNSILAINSLTDKANIPRYNNNFLNYMNKVVEICPSYNDYAAYYYLGEYYYVENLLEDAQKNLLTYIELNENGQDKLNIAKNYSEHIKIYKNLMENPVEFNPVKLEGVCTSEDEFLPLISPDGEFAFYTHRYFKKLKNAGPDKKMVEEFTYSIRINPLSETKEVYENGIAMPEPFNQGLNQGGVSITIDNNHLYITICQLEKVRTNRGMESYNNCDIYVSHNVNGKWTALENLGPNINSNKTWEGQPSISADGKTLYFASAREGGYGGTDIYYSKIDDKGNWGLAQNIGDVINTKKNDKSPFMHSDSQTLYYASDGKYGLGGFDIYFSKNVNGKWTEPKNIGYPINTPEDELGFIVSTNGSKAYFASNRLTDDGGYDIFSFDLYQKARPKEVMLAKGTVNDSKGKVIEDAEVVIKSTTTGKSTEAIVDKMTGKYAVAIAVEPDDEFIMTVRKQDYAFTSAYIKPKETSLIAPIKIDMQVKPIQVGEQVKINDIYFPTASAVFDKASMIVLNNFVEWLEANPKVKIEIHGHTDNTGDKERNQTLSEERAKAVADYLILFGIEGDRIVAHKGFGQDKPVASNKTEEGRAKNRRTEFVIVSK